METGEKEKSKFYMQKYTALKDSIYIAKRKNIDATVTKMLSEAEDSHNEDLKKKLIITGILALASTLFIIILWRRRNKIFHKNYMEMIEKLKNEISAHQTEIAVEIDHFNDERQFSENKNVISNHTEARILKRLESFEKSKKFLRKDLTVSLLASQLNTNSKYLSEIIKNNKSQTFSNYINGLKINYIVHKLYNDSKYRNYKISYLAEACGYASPQVFILAFKKINGVTPSYFIQSLNKDDKDNNI